MSDGHSQEKEKKNNIKKKKRIDQFVLNSFSESCKGRRRPLINF